MKRFFVLTAVFAAMFLMISCGSSTDSDGVTYDGKKYCAEFYSNGECKGHDVKACAEDDKTWYEVEGAGKKFYCNKDDDCTQAAYDLTNYCFDTNIDYEEEDGTTCVTTEEADTCGGKVVKYCSKDEGYWYEVDGKKFECKEAGSEECTQAMLEFSTYCAEAEENAENGEGNENGEEGNEGGENGEGNEGGESTFTEKATAYLPVDYADKTLAAWYSLTDEDKDKIKIEAIFLFDDNTLVKTTSKIYSEEDGREPSDKLEAEGEFTVTSGDYENGEAHVVAGEMEFDVTISDGVLSAMGAEFIKQDNADAPEAR